MAGSNDVVIIAGCRTPIGKFQGSLSDIGAPQLGAIAVREAVKRANVQPQQVDECIMGNVVSAGLGQNPARQAALFGGLAPEVGAMTINKVCGSGLKAVALAAQAIVDHARRRPDQRLRQNLQHQRQRHRPSASGELQQQVVDRQGVKPIAEFADNLRTPQSAKIPVAAQQAHIRSQRHRANFQFRSRFHADVRSEFHSIPDRAKLPHPELERCTRRQNCAKQCARQKASLWKTVERSTFWATFARGNDLYELIVKIGWSESRMPLFKANCLTRKESSPRAKVRPCSSASPNPGCEVFCSTRACGRTILCHSGTRCPRLTRRRLSWPGRLDSASPQRLIPSCREPPRHPFLTRHFQTWPEPTRPEPGGQSPPSTKQA